VVDRDEPLLVGAPHGVDQQRLDGGTHRRQLRAPRGHGRPGVPADRPGGDAGGARAAGDDGAVRPEGEEREPDRDAEVRGGHAAQPPPAPGHEPVVPEARALPLEQQAARPAGAQQLAAGLVQDVDVLVRRGRVAETAPVGLLPRRGGRPPDRAVEGPDPHAAPSGAGAGRRASASSGTNAGGAFGGVTSTAESSGAAASTASRTASSAAPAPHPPAFPARATRAAPPSTPTSSASRPRRFSSGRSRSSVRATRRSTGSGCRPCRTSR